MFGSERIRIARQRISTLVGDLDALNSSNRGVVEIVLRSQTVDGGLQRLYLLDLRFGFLLFLSAYLGMHLITEIGAGLPHD